MQPQNYQPQNVKPQGQPQSYQPQNYQPQNLQPQRSQGYQPANPYQPQNVQPQTYQPPSQPQNQPKGINYNLDQYDSTLNEDLKSIGISVDDLADGLEQKMDALGFSSLPNDTLDYDEDNNIATDFKISGTTNTVVGEIHDIVFRPLSNGQPCNINHPLKYISVDLIHENGKTLSPWFRDNQNCTYSLGFCSEDPGRIQMTIALMKQPLFNLNIFVSDGGEEKQWIARYPPPFVGRPWVVKIVRVDGQPPQGKHPFDVSSEGPVKELAIRQSPGGYEVICTPTASGPVTIEILLFGAHINSSPVRAQIIDTNSMQQQAPRGQPQNMQPQNMQPRNMQPQNMQPQNMQPQNRQPQNMQPQNLQPQNVKPQGYQPQSLQPQNLQPQNLQPQNLKPQGYQPQNLQPQNQARPPASAPTQQNLPVHDALSDLLNLLDLEN
uniref:Uncharacterized protein n=1 Tax=Arcella intermedia TaxID=1963864 RepID=A0A6B2L4G1_9EUKA